VCEDANVIVLFYVYLCSKITHTVVDKKME